MYIKTGKILVKSRALARINFPVTCQKSATQSPTFRILTIVLSIK